MRNLLKQPLRRITWTWMTFVAGVLLGGSTYAIAPVQLRCEAAANPLGIDQSQPQLGWRLESKQRGAAQSAYQVLAASVPEVLAQDKGDLWDSGQVKSDHSIQITYAGAPLRSAQQVFWKVRTWDEAGQPSAWSEPASWTMGLLGESDWAGAQWITAKGAVIPERVARGYHAAVANRQDDEKWVQVDLGQPMPISAVRLHPIQHQDRHGFGFPARYRVEVSNDPDFAQLAGIIADNTEKDVPNPHYRIVTLKANDSAATQPKVRYVRVTATKLWARDAASFAFALRQIEVISNGRNVAAGQRVTAKDSVEDFGWGMASVTDGLGLITAARDEKYPTVRLRRELSVKPRLRRALVMVCGLGQYELTLDGARVGEDLLAPGWTNYKKTCLYGTFDVSAQLQRGGPHVFGLLLGNGMYRIAPDLERYVKFTQSFGPLQAIAQIRLEYADGTTEIIGTDTAWQVAPGPITYNNIFGGEDYDARLEARGWDAPGFNAAKWESAIIAGGPGGRLRGHSAAAPPIRAFDAFKPVSSHELRPGLAIYDLGQNASIMPRLTVEGPAGSCVCIIPSELLKPDGTLDRTSATQDGARPAGWQYTLKGEGKESWFPKFFYQGGRYLQVERLPATPGGALPTVESIEGVAVHSASTPVGEFTCSNTLFNRIYRLVRWAQRSNMVSLMTDCPHREKLGWLEETHLNGPSLRYNYDLAQLFQKSMNDMADSQLENGFVPNIAPEYFIAGSPELKNGMRNSPEWGGAFVMVPWQQYQFNGDAGLLRRHYEDMKRYVAFLGSTASNHIVETGLGDWCDIGPNPSWGSQLTPPALTATAFYQHFNWILARTAELLGKPDEARQHDERAGQIRDAFNRQFFNPETRQYASGSQCANSIAGVLDLVEATHRAAVLEAIVADVRKRDNGLTAGDVGYRYLLRALADSGHSDVVFDMNNQSNKPGYGYQLAKGATSLTEKWDASIDRGFGSQNHFMLGQINEWFFHDLAGIQCDPAGPGFKKIIIKPAIVGDLTEVKASYDSVHGKISSEWQRAGQAVSLHVVIPANTTAQIAVPAVDSTSVRESGKPAAQSAGVRFLRTDGNCVMYQVGSGEYTFEATVPAAAAN